MVGFLTLSTSMQRLASLDIVTRSEAIHAVVVTLHCSNPLIRGHGLKLGAGVKGMLTTLA